MRCLGTQERLKARFGNGYMLAVVATEGRIADAEAYVAQIMPNAQFLESFADTVRYRIAKVRLAMSAAQTRMLQQALARPPVTRPLKKPPPGPGPGSDPRFARPAHHAPPDRHCRQQGHARVHRAKARLRRGLGPVDDDHRRRLFAHCAP